MTDINHRRKNRKPVNQRYKPDEYHNGYAPGLGKNDYLDKSMHGWGAYDPVSKMRFGSAGIGNDFTNGHRGMAKAVRGAKKFVRTRIRFNANAATKKLARDNEDA